jgi:hypothetical protein
MMKAHVAAGRALRLVVLTFVAQGLCNLRVKGMRTNRPGAMDSKECGCAPRKMQNSVATTMSSNPSNSPIILIFSDSKSNKHIVDCSDMMAILESSTLSLDYATVHVHFSYYESTLLSTCPRPEFPPCSISVFQRGSNS